MSAARDKITNSPFFKTNFQMIRKSMSFSYPIAECRPKKTQIRKRRQVGTSCKDVRCDTPAGCAMVRPSGCMDSPTMTGCELKPTCIHVNGECLEDFSCCT